MAHQQGSREIWRLRIAALAGGAAVLATLPPVASAAAQLPPPSQRTVIADPDPAHWIVPAVKHWVPAFGEYHLSPRTIIAVQTPAPEAEAVAKRLQSELASEGEYVAVRHRANPGSGDIVLQVGDPGKGLADEAYRLTLGSAAVIRSRTSAGLFYGTRSLLQLLRHAADRRSVPAGDMIDWPDYPLREVMLDVGRKYYSVDVLDVLMRRMAWYKLNTLHLHFNDWSAFRLRSSRYLGLAASEAYDRADVAHLEEVAAANHILIIPELDLPAHASALITYRPSLAFACPSMRQSEWLQRSAPDRAASLAWTVDVTREENRTWLRGLLDEFVPWFRGPYFHIGGDEYQYDSEKERCPELLRAARERGLQTPGDVFVDWIDEANRIVRAHGKTTVMWNWWRFKNDKTSIEPNKNIVVDTWNSPRLASVLASGYRVIVSPEDTLYVVPGIANFDGHGYGVVDTRSEYETMPLVHQRAVLGYSVALWADAAETATDESMLGHLFDPMVVLAERLWGERASTGRNAFFDRVNRAGPQPASSRIDAKTKGNRS